MGAPAAPGGPASPDMTQPHVHLLTPPAPHRGRRRSAWPAGISQIPRRGLRGVATGAPRSRAWGGGRGCGPRVCVSRPRSGQRDPDPASRRCFPARCCLDAGTCGLNGAVLGTESGSLSCAVGVAPRFCSQGRRPPRSAHDRKPQGERRRVSLCVLRFPRQKFPPPAAVTSHICLSRLLRPTVSPHLGAQGLC